MRASDAGAGQQIGSAAASILARRSERARAEVLDHRCVRRGEQMGARPPQRRRMASTTLRNACLTGMRRQRSRWGGVVVRGRVRLHGKQPASSGLDVDEQRQTCLGARRFVRTVVKRGVGPCGGADFDACPGRESYPPDI